MARSQQLTNRQKAAIFLISLGPDLSAEIFKHLEQDEIEQLTLEIANVQKVERDSKELVLDEFNSLWEAKEYVSQGGIEYARNVLEKALGPQQAASLLERLTASLRVRPFEIVRRTDPGQLLSLIQGEHPQTIALILAYLHADQAATIMASLDPDLQADVARRLAIMDRTSPELLKEVERLLENKLANMATQEFAQAGGIESLVQVLNKVDRATERTILESLEIQDPDLAEEIKKRMFVFEDIILLDDRSVQRVLREVDMNEDLPMALKIVSDDVKEKIFKNISKRAAENLTESIEYLGPVRLKDIEETQQKIVNVIRRLEEEGEILIARGGGDEIVV